MTKVLLNRKKPKITTIKDLTVGTWFRIKINSDVYIKTDRHGGSDKASWCINILNGMTLILEDDIEIVDVISEVSINEK